MFKRLFHLVSPLLFGSDMAHARGVLLAVSLCSGCTVGVVEDDAGGQDDEELIDQTQVDDAVAAGPRDPWSRYRYAPIGGTTFVRGDGDAAAIDGNDVAQGHLNDCWVLAPLIAVARMNPQAVERLIHLRPDGNYDVTLYLGPTTYDDDGVRHRAPRVMTVSPTFPVDDDGALVYAHPRDYGPSGPELWPLLIEKAYARYEGSYDGWIPVIGSDLNGNLSPSFNAFLPRGRRESFDPGRMDDDRILSVIAGAFDAHRPATALVTLPANTDVADTYGLVTWHHYAIVGVDRVRKTIALEDPVRSRTAPRALPVAAFRSVFTLFHLGGDATASW